MKKRLLSLIAIAMLTTVLVACSSSSSYEYEEDDSWKTKKWNDLSGSEREKATEYMSDYIRENNAY